MINKITPPEKFCKVPESAIPIAKPAAPSIAMNEVISIPTIPMTVITNNTFKTMLNKLFKKGFREASISLLSKRLDTVFVKNLMTHNPIIKVKIAKINLGP